MTWADSAPKQGPQRGALRFQACGGLPQNPLLNDENQVKLYPTRDTEMGGGPLLTFLSGLLTRATIAPPGSSSAAPLIHSFFLPDFLPGRRDRFRLTAVGKCDTM